MLRLTRPGTAMLRCPRCHGTGQEPLPRWDSETRGEAHRERLRRLLRYRQASHCRAMLVLLPVDRELPGHRSCHLDSALFGGANCILPAVLFAVGLGGLLWPLWFVLSLPLWVR